MTVERRPVAFGDLRGWIAALKSAGELQEIGAEVDWNIEIGTIMRLAQGAGTGPALLFNNIKDYHKADSRCGRLFGNGLSSYRRVAMMLGLPPDTHPRELVKIGRNVLNGSIPPRIVKTGPVKENVVTGKDIDLYDFPIPHWNRLDGGRYILTYGGVVTKDPTTDVMNVGIYRGMVASRDTIPILMWRAQHIGHHVTAWRNGGAAVPPSGHVMADVLGTPHQDRNGVAARHHAAIDADVHDIGGGILGHDAAIGEDVAPAVEPVPVRDREIIEVDVFAGDDVLFHRPGLDDPGRDAAVEDVAADLHQFARMRIRRKPQHHGDAPVARQAIAEKAPAAAIRLVIILDVVEQQRRAGSSALRQAHDGPDLDIPVDFSADFLQFARGLQRCNPAAKISKRHRLSLHGHSVLLAFTSPRLNARFRLAQRS